MPIVTRVTLPRASGGEVHDASAWAKVELSRDGRLWHDGTRVTLEELGRRLAAEPDRPVLLCADAQASLLNAIFVFHEIPGKVVWVAVTDGWRDAVLPVGLRWPTWAFNVGVGIMDMFGVDARVPDARSCEYYVDPWDEDAASTRDLDELVDLLEDERDEAMERLTEQGADDPQPTGVIVAASNLPFQAYVTAIDSLRAAGVVEVEPMTIHAPPHPWVARQPVIPDPEYAIIVEPVAWPVVPSPAAVSLPLAPSAEPDRSRWGPRAGKRVSLNLDAAHCIVYRGKSVTLDGLATILERAREWFHRYRGARELRDQPYDPGRWMSLPVVVRIDKEAAWRDVVPFLATLRAQRLHVVDFSALNEADLSHSPEEAAFVGLPRRERVPFPPGWNDDRLLTELWNRDGKAPVVKLHVSAAGTFALGDGPPGDLAALADALGGIAEETCVALTADPATPWRVVVAAMDRAYAAGVRRFDFPDARPAR
jgi:biopolymer transport protein ExbD